ncbi:MAG: ABC transporter permease [Candidatus Acidiferrales bacterium]
MMTAGMWLRSWRRSPLLTGQFAFTIAIGMGATSALVSLMLALGYQPLPFRDPGRLVAVWERADSGAQNLAISRPDLADFANATHGIFAALGAFTVPPGWLLDRKGAAQIRACYIDASAFSDLGIRPDLGRGVRPDDAPITSSGTPPVWISNRLWQTRYGGSSSAIGMTIEIADNQAGRDATAMRIAGVLPPSVSIPLPFMENSADVWYLLSPDVAAHSRETKVFFGLGRLNPGVTVTQAQAALAVVAQQLGQRYSFDAHKIPVVQSLEAIAQGPARQTMGLLALGVGFVFLLGCVNLAILMGAEGRRLRREIAIRSVLGAGRSRLWQEVAAEKCMLTVLSLGLGAAFAFELLRVFTQLMPAAGLGPPLLHPPPLNLLVLLTFATFALIAALVWSALLVGAANTAESTHTLAAAGSGLGYTGLSDSARGAGRWRLILLAAQAGVGICLLAAAVLTARTYATLSVANLGPAPRRMLLLTVQQRDNFVPSDAQVADFDQQVLSRLSRLPGTETITLVDRFPPVSSPISFMKQDDAAGAAREANSPMPVSPSYFRTLGIPILFGRSFDDTDNSGSEPVAIISLEMAKENWASPEQAVGSEIFFGEKSQDESKEKSKEESKRKAEEQVKEASKDQSANHYKIVGVAANFSGYWSQKPSPAVYLPLAQAAYALGGEVILRTSASPQAVAALAPQALTEMAIPSTISDVSTMEARWQATLTRPLARMFGMLLLALLGLELSVQGVYAVAAATVSARQHELAVRAALGALPNRLVWNVTRELLLAVIVGAGLGVAAALELRPLLAHWLGPVAVWQAEPILAALLFMAMAAAAGCYFPARAATRANPADILRQG